MLLETQSPQGIAKYTEKTLRPGRQSGMQNGLPEGFVVKGTAQR